MYKALICFTLTAAAGFALAGDAPASGADAGHRGERHAAMRAEMAARFADADVDGDGSLDRIEATALNERLGEHFAKIDADGNGELTKEEMARAHRQHRGGHGRSYMAGLIQGMDDDGNGAISRAELGDKAPRLAENFAAIDADNDGELARDEMRAHHEAMRAERRAARGGTGADGAAPRTN